MDSLWTDCDAMDDGTSDGSCSAPKRVFVTKNLYDSVNGIDRSIGDARCNAAVLAAGLPGTYVAWLSLYFAGPPEVWVDAADRIPEAEYRLVDGTLVADSKADLLDGSLDHAIDHDEYGAAITVPPSATNLVWSATNTDGTADWQTCTNWTGGGTYLGASFDTTSGAWTLGGAILDCSTIDTNGGAHLYCFQQ